MAVADAAPGAAPTPIAAASDAAFLATVPVFASFARIADPACYRPLPAGWVIGLADVVGSTDAIAAGRYQAVNMAGAAVISAMSNALGRLDFPFVFGGDGASFTVAPGEAGTARAALAATAAFARDELDLELRVALVPVETIRAAGHDVTVGRFAASPGAAYAMFSGGGLAWAEAAMKAGDFRLPPAPAGTRPDLSGLSCRFDRMTSRRGTVVSLIVRPGEAGDGEAYRGAISAILRIVEAEMGTSPVPPEGPPVRLLSAGARLEARARRAAGGSRLLGAASTTLRAVFSALVFRTGWRVAGFQPARYLRQVAANSDYRKYDDGLRMTLDCPPALVAALEAKLARAAEAGTLTYGLHRQAAAIMTCFTPSVYRDDHIHFVDGASGGYAAAAAELKGIGRA